MVDNYSDKISNNLKIKPFESLFIILPKICEYYANKNNLNYNPSEFYSFLLTKIRCHLIVVYKSGLNHINDEKTFASDIKDKYRVLKNNNIITDFKVYDEVDFENNLLKDIENFSCSHINIITNVCDPILNKTKNPKEFGDLIDLELENYITQNKITIDNLNKERLRKIISKCCMDYIN